ncbi:MAG TPA: HlyD family efflux transporter periplasmic adaptor subunit [Polyangiaceae bacterium]|nr:HlyD family efflux transporter periplasmic adaptor subunit [Polyangiaceae bacterium]
MGVRWLGSLVLGAWIAGGCVAGGCRGVPDRSRTDYAGVVEYDERLLSFEVTGRLLERPVERGQRVETGTRLALLDSSLESASSAIRSAELAGARARAELVAAGPKAEDLSALASQVAAARAVEQRLSTNLAREKQLFERGVTAPAPLDDLSHQLAQARAQRASLQAQYDSLKRGARKEEIAAAEAQTEAAQSALTLEQERVERYELKAPISGEILDVHANSGEIVAVGTPVVTLADVEHPYIEVFVPQTQLAGIAIGREGVLHVDAHPGGFPGVVEYVSSRVEYTPRYLFSEQERPRLVVRVRLRIRDPKHELVAGVPGFVSFP